VPVPKNSLEEVASFPRGLEATEEDRRCVRLLSRVFYQFSYRRFERREGSQRLNEGYDELA
jgi:hypothetical protein